MKKNKLHLTRRAGDSLASNPSTPDWLCKGEPEGEILAKLSTLEAGGSPGSLLAWRRPVLWGYVSKHAAPQRDTPEV